MQEPMNSIIHQWSHSWYRSRYCPSSIVQAGGDTAINGTVPIYFRASPDLCHHIGRGINPRGRAVTQPPFHAILFSYTLLMSLFRLQDRWIHILPHSRIGGQLYASLSLAPSAVLHLLHADSCPSYRDPLFHAPIVYLSW